MKHAPLNASIYNLLMFHTSISHMQIIHTHVSGVAVFRIKLAFVPIAATSAARLSFGKRRSAKIT
jgi:hypothetical protein